MNAAGGHIRGGRGGAPRAGLAGLRQRGRACGSRCCCSGRTCKAGEWTYGRWVPAHLNVQLYGWTSLPLVAWLFAIYEVDLGRARAWAPAAVWGVDRGAGGRACMDWLNGGSSGKIFLDWKGGALVAFLLAQMIVWWVLAVAWRDRAARWSATAALAFARRPARTGGGSGVARHRLFAGGLSAGGP